MRVPCLGIPRTTKWIAKGNIASLPLSSTTLASILVVLEASSY